MYREEKNMREVFKLVNELKTSQKEIIFLDAETTGLKKDAQIIELAMVKCRFDRKFIETEQKDFYIRPYTLVEERIEAFTGITNEFLKEQPFEDDVFGEIRDFMGEAPIIAAYNAPFDIGKLEMMYERQGESFSPASVFDVLELARDVVPTEIVKTFDYQISKLEKETGRPLSDHCLQVMCLICSVDNTGLKFHNAIDDTVMTIRLANKLLGAAVKIASERQAHQKRKIQVLGVNFKDGYTGHDRLYVKTSMGQLFYDVYNKEWRELDFGFSGIDMETVIGDVKKLLGASDMKEAVKAAKKGESRK